MADITITPDEIADLKGLNCPMPVLKTKKALAPNPFWDYCTLAVCTPNHMGIRAEPGDWFLGTTTSERGNKLLYAM